MSTFTITVPRPGRRTGWFAALLATGLLVVTIVGPALGPRPILATDSVGSPPEHTISVTGAGRVLISPDVADVRLGVSVTRPTVKAARDVAAADMTKVLAALRGLGIADRDIQTTTLSLQPSYDGTTGPGQPRPTGYQLSNQVVVTVRNLDKVGDVIDGGIAAGGTTVDGVNFRVNDPAAAQTQARQAAMTQARAQADTLAAAAGVSISGVASISETSGPIPYRMAYEAAAPLQDKSYATPIQPGTNEVTVSVSVAYLIR